MIKNRTTGKAIVQSPLSLAIGTIYDPQSSSELFTIPPELRNKIFIVVLTTYDTSERYEYEGKADHPKKGFENKKHIDVALLLSCKLIYNEAHRIPVANRQHVFWHNSFHHYLFSEFYFSPLNVKFSSDIKGYFEQMSAWQQRDVRNIHIFVKRPEWLMGPQVRHNSDRWTVSFDSICALPAFQNITRLVLDVQRYQYGRFFFSPFHAQFSSSISKLTSLQELRIDYGSSSCETIMSFQGCRMFWDMDPAEAVKSWDFGSLEFMEDSRYEDDDGGSSAAVKRLIYQDRWTNEFDNKIQRTFRWLRAASCNSSVQENKKIDASEKI